MSLFLGYDPGGNGNHGIASLEIGPHTGQVVRLSTDLVATADTALKYFLGTMAAEPVGGIGVDTLTEWCLGASGWRPADRWLRDRYPEVKKSVASPNSLYGAMSINGMGVVHALRRVDPDLVVTEAHPKVVYFATSGNKYDWERNRRAMTTWLGDLLNLPALSISSEDEFDAALSAWSCAQGVQGPWKNDLRALTARPEEAGTAVQPAGPTSYFWPSPT